MDGDGTAQGPRGTLFAPVQMPDGVLDLEEAKSVADVLALAERLGERLAVERSEGVGAHRGKRYVRFTVEGPVLAGGKLYSEAKSAGPVAEVPEAQVQWRAFGRAPEQVAADLVQEYEVQRQAHPELAARADRLWETVEPRLEAEGLLKGTVAQRVWLTLMAALVSSQTGASFGAAIYNARVGAVVGETFGVDSWLAVATV
jgi:hypothetical protein